MAIEKNNKRRMYDEAYCRVFGLPIDTKFSIEQMAEMGQLGTRLQMFPGVFPGETDEMISIRERDKTIVNGDFNNFSGAMRKLKLWKDTEDKWFNIWSIYKKYVKDYDKELVEKQEELTPDPIIIEDSKWEEQEALAAAAVASVVNSGLIIDGNADSNNIMIIPKEEKQMNETRLTPDELNALADGSNKANDGSQAAEDAMQKFRAGTPVLGADNNPVITTTTPAGGFTAVTPLDEQQQVVAARAAESQVAKRGTWSQSHKIEAFILGHRPLKERMMNPEQKNYKIVNPSKTMLSVLKRVFDVTEESKLPVEALTGCTKEGVMIIPDSVKAAGSADSYKQVIEVLAAAIKNPEVTTEVSQKYNFNGYKGIKLTAEVSETIKRQVLKWKETKKIAADHSLMGISAVSDESIGLKVIVINLVDASGKTKQNLSINEAADLCQIRVADGGGLVDKDTGAIKNSSLVRYAFDQAETAANDPLRTARSVIRFSYKGKFMDSKKGESTRMMTVPLNLEVPVKAESTTDEYKIFENTIGKPVSMNTTEEAAATVNNFVKAQMSTNRMTSDVRNEASAAAVASRQTNASAASDLMNNMGA